MLSKYERVLGRSTGDQLGTALREVLEQKQLGDLKEIVEFAYDHAPHYKRSFDDAGVKPSDIQGLKDIERFPFNNKKTQRASQGVGSLLGELAAVPEEDVIFVSASSGSTGVPTMSPFTKKDFDEWQDVESRLFWLAGMRKNDRYIHALNFSLYVGGPDVIGAQNLGALCIWAARCRPSGSFSSSRNTSPRRSGLARLMHGTSARPRRRPASTRRRTLPSNASSSPARWADPSPRRGRPSSSSGGLAWTGSGARHIGFVPTAIATHTEPFHLSKAIATLDYVSSGRAGIRVQVAARAGTADHFGRRKIPPLQADRLADPDVQRVIAEHFDEAADYVEVLRRLWDSWEDDAEIRDVATGRFIDRDKLHYIDFEGRWFSVKGPSITPRPPQGQPVVAALGHASVPDRLIARSADVGFVTPCDAAHAAEIVTQIRAEQTRAGRAAQTLHVFGDLVAFLDETETVAAARKQRLDERAGAEYRSDAHVYTGTAAGLADLLQDWQAAGLSGFRLRRPHCRTT
jgi:alkanesulfonate monooxygenase SsuD/methylene tetrahydromethanopterin reductase-like flavin-dependent oxidoreductase (luciferase family)